MYIHVDMLGLTKGKTMQDAIDGVDVASLPRIAGGSLWSLTKFIAHNGLKYYCGIK